MDQEQEHGVWIDQLLNLLARIITYTKITRFAHTIHTHLHILRVFCARGEVGKPPFLRYVMIPFSEWLAWPSPNRSL